MKYSERFRCPECGHSVTVYVRTSEPPTCSNPEAHSSKTVEMVSRRKINQPH